MNDLKELSKERVYQSYFVICVTLRPTLTVTMKENNNNKPYLLGVIGRTERMVQSSTPKRGSSRTALGAAVGERLGTAVGAALGVALGTAVGAKVGDCVGASVGASVGVYVGAFVGVCVGPSVLMVSTRVDLPYAAVVPSAQVSYTPSGQTSNRSTCTGVPEQSVLVYRLSVTRSKRSAT